VTLRLTGAKERVSLGIAAVTVGLAVVLAACSAQPAHQAVRQLGRHAVLASTARTAAEHQRRQLRSGHQKTRTFRLGAGRATRTFTIRERSGVILLNQLTVRHGVRAFVKARIPHLAGAEVWTWASRNRPSASCTRRGAFNVCTQGEEWCPMPSATWHFRLVKLSGPAGPVRFSYVVAAPPKR
jgi:hypothetical protein